MTCRLQGTRHHYPIHQHHEFACAAAYGLIAFAATASAAVAMIPISAAVPAAKHWSNTNFTPPTHARGRPRAAFVPAPMQANGLRKVLQARHAQRVQALSMKVAVATAPAAIPHAGSATVAAAEALPSRRRRRGPKDGSGEDYTGWGSGLGGVLSTRNIPGGVMGGVGGSVGGAVLKKGMGGGLDVVGWHPASEPSEAENDETYYENWRQLRVEELWKDQYLTPGRVNEIMDPSNLQRHQYNTNPDSSFGAVFQLDTLVDVIPGLIYPAWLEVARALNQRAPTLNTVQRGYGSTPDQMFLREFNWRLTQEELEGGIEIYDRTILRQARKYEPTEKRGSRRWLETLRGIPMPMAVISRLPSSVVNTVLEKTGLGGYFPHRVTAEDEKFDDYRGYMLGALKVGRSTMKCCAFDCRQEGMIKAHDAELRGICQIGVMAAWELKLADYSVECFDDITVLDFRQIFADREFEPGGAQLELAPEAAPKRKTMVATKVQTRWADEEEEPETWSDGGGDGRVGTGGGGGGLRRRY